MARGKKELPIDKIIKLYQNNNITQQQLADMYEVSPATIKRRIEGYYSGEKRVYKKRGK